MALREGGLTPSSFYIQPEETSSRRRRLTVLALNADAGETPLSECEELKVTKWNGDRQEYDPEKILGTLSRYGVTSGEAEEVLAEIESRLVPGIRTSEILGIMHQRLDELESTGRLKRDLRSALGMMRSAPDFEEYVRLLLCSEGYDVRPNAVIRGRCVKHEIDGVLEREGELVYLETKHHRRRHSYTPFAVSLSAKAKFDDIRRGYEEGLNDYDFSRVLIVCNTRMTEHARVYADCVGIDHVGWKAPPGRGIDAMITEAGVYPVTMLRSVGRGERDALSEAGIVTLQQLTEYRGRPPLPAERFEGLRGEAERVLGI